MNVRKETSQLKQPTTFTQQVEIYKKRKLLIEDEKYTENILQRVNYYRLSAYTLTLKNPLIIDEFFPGTTFSKLLSLYEFDRELRLILIGVLENIEIAFRTHIAYLIAHKYGPLGYKMSENFKDMEIHNKFISNLEEQFMKSKKGEMFIIHHFKTYNGQIPIWVAIEVTSFGEISKLFSNLKERDKQEISKTYYNLPYKYLESWLKTLSNIRNICAHYGRLYNKKLVTPPKLFKNEKNIIDNTSLFSAIYITQRLLTRIEGERFINNLKTLIENYKELNVV